MCLTFGGQGCHYSPVTASVIGSGWGGEAGGDPNALWSILLRHSWCQEFPSQCSMDTFHPCIPWCREAERKAGCPCRWSSWSVLKQCSSKHGTKTSGIDGSSPVMERDTSPLHARTGQNHTAAGLTSSHKNQFLSPRKAPGPVQKGFPWTSSASLLPGPPYCNRSLHFTDNDTGI